MQREESYPNPSELALKIFQSSSIASKLVEMAYLSGREAFNFIGLGKFVGLRLFPSPSSFNTYVGYAFVVETQIGCHFAVIISLQT